MRVICIDAKKHDDSLNYIPLLKEGTTYHVEREVEADDSFGNCHMAYKLAEFNWPYAFNKDRFIPLSSIDETEMIKEREVTV